MELRIKPKQMLALVLLLKKAFTLLYGGARSGKTFIMLFFTLLIANTFDPDKKKKDKNYEIREPSRHLIVRHHFSDVRKSIIQETLPKVAELMGIKYTLNQVQWFITLENGSEIWFGGIDEGRGLDRVLGKEYLTIWYNEISEIKYNAFWFVMSRLAQDTGFRNRHLYDKGFPMAMKKALGYIGDDEKGNPIFDGDLSELSNRVFCDENPPSKSHWSWKVFFEGVDPLKRTIIRSHESRYGQMRLNPIDNQGNIAKGFIENLQDAPDKIRKRFLDGEFDDDIYGTLFSETNINQYRLIPGKDTLPEMARVVIPIDPATTSKDSSDETGLVACGRGFDGRGYLLEDGTDIYTPAEWAKKAKELYIRWGAQIIVAETNQGGEMVEHTIQSEDRNLPVKTVHAKDGKVLRAQPVSHMYSRGRISHWGSFPDAEDEMVTYTGATGEKSPNRLDAIVYGFLELFPVGIDENADLFGQKKLKYFESDEDFSKCKIFSVIKISDADNYKFVMMKFAIKNGMYFIMDTKFSHALPLELLPEIIFSLNGTHRVIVESDVSYSDFTVALSENLPSTDVCGAELPEDTNNSIIMEAQYIKDNFCFRDDLDEKNEDGSIKYEEYKLFMRQLNSYTNLSRKEDSHAPEICASASYFLKSFADEYGVSQDQINARFKELHPELSKK